MRVPSRKKRSAQNVVVRSLCTERSLCRRGLDIHNASKTYFARTSRNKMVTVIKTFQLGIVDINVDNFKYTLHIYTCVAYLYIYMYIYIYIYIYMRCVCLCLCVSPYMYIFISLLVSLCISSTLR